MFIESTYNRIALRAPLGATVIADNPSDRRSAEFPPAREQGDSDKNNRSGEALQGQLPATLGSAAQLTSNSRVSCCQG
jgi:hypothetical protein